MKKSLKRGRKYMYIYCLVYQTFDGKTFSIMAECLKELKSISAFEEYGYNALNCEANLINVSYLGKRRIK